MGFEFTPEELTSMNEAVETILSILNSKGLINLTPQERKAAATVGNRRRHFRESAF